MGLAVLGLLTAIISIAIFGFLCGIAWEILKFFVKIVRA